MNDSTASKSGVKRIEKFGCPNTKVFKKCHELFSGWKVKLCLGIEI
jgi:hypothetical protein